MMLHVKYEQHAIILSDDAKRLVQHDDVHAFLGLKFFNKWIEYSATTLAWGLWWWEC